MKTIDANKLEQKIDRMVEHLEGVVAYYGKDGNYDKAYYNQNVLEGVHRVKSAIELGDYYL